MHMGDNIKLCLKYGIKKELDLAASGFDRVMVFF
jgi:hypothetical protein